ARELAALLQRQEVGEHVWEPCRAAPGRRGCRKLERMPALPASVLALCGLAASACGGAPPGAPVADQMARRDAAPTASAEPAGTAGSARPAEKAPVVRPLDGRVVVIDPGHNGGNARAPKEINRKV